MTADKNSVFKYQVETKQLWPRSSYLIYQPGIRGRDLLIKRKDGAPINHYEPFEFYTEDRDKSPHRQFDALDLFSTASKRNDQILSFVNEWGLLGLSGYGPMNQSESVIDFKTEQRLFHSVVVMAKAIQYKETDSLVKALNDFSRVHWQTLKPASFEREDFPNTIFLALQETKDGPREWTIDSYDTWFTNWPHLEAQWGKGAIRQDSDSEFIYWLAGCITHTLLKRGLAGVQLSASFHGQGVRTFWLYTSLLSSLYLMYWLDLERIKDWQTCEYCGAYFIHDRRVKYCPDKRCAKNAAQARYAKGETKPRKTQNRMSGKSK